MRNKSGGCLWVVLALLVFIGGQGVSAENRLQQAWDALKNGSQIEVYFSPYDNCEKPWVDTIMKASSYVYVSCFGLTNGNITKALCDVSKKGIKVIVCTDKMQAGNKTALIREQELRQAGAEYVIKKIQVLEHNKMLFVRTIEGDQYAIIGSWNLSGNAQPQDNSIVVIKDKNITDKVKLAIERIYNRDKVK